MRILLLSLNFAPELTGIGKYSGEMAERLVARGHEVTVVCAPPYYPQWKVHKDYSATGYQVERPKPGLTVHRCPVWVPGRASGAKRLLHLASFALSCLPVMLWLVLWRPAVVFVVAPALFCTPVGWLTARLSGAKAWLHIQDLEVDAAFELGLMTGKMPRRVLLAIERWAMRRFDKVSTISRRMLRKLAAKGVQLEKAEMFPNWVDVELIRPVDASPEMRASLNIGPEQIVCLFSGTMNRKQGLPVLIETARQLRDRSDVVIVICGNGELRPPLEEQAAGLDNVRFMDLQPAAQLNALLNMADIHLLPQLRGAAELVMPSKLTGMLASGRPVVAAADPGTEIASIVSGRGLIIEPESVDAFAAAITQLAADPALRRDYGAAARSYAERVLDCDGVMNSLDLKLQQVCDPMSLPLATGPQRSL
ncbi:glycosyltransferase WbuB [Methylibium sp.]|uniref:glycosyltransferase WbuB n=1 Tax=Methylibium sp. TaxID=2067992 RepID=UPI003D13226A